MGGIKGLFDLTGKVALLVGHEGNLGPIWKETLEGAGATVDALGLPEVDFLGPGPMTIINTAVPNIVVCNAAIDTPPSQQDARFFDRLEDTIHVNLNMHAWICKETIPAMIDNGGGVIVFIGSIMGYVGADWRNYSGGFEKPVAYNLSKAALQQLARSITVQYGRHNIRAVCPGFGPVATPKLPREFVTTISEKIPMERLVSKRSLQQTLLYACCCEELAGEDWLVDGGYTKW